MAEAIGVAASLINIATYAFQTSKEVYDLVDSIQRAPQTIRELKSELIALGLILSSIQELVASDRSYQISIASVWHANGNRSVRDLVRFIYKGKTIDGYKGQLASYKATIGIALNTFTLTSSALTAEAVDEMKVMIYDAIGKTQPDLEMQTEEINDSLERLAIERSALSNALQNQTGESTSIQILEEREKALEEDRLALEAEKEAMEHSQRVCAAAEKRIEGVHPQPKSQSICVTFSGANNSGFQLGQNTGTISNLRWDSNP